MERSYDGFERDSRIAVEDALAVPVNARVVLAYVETMGPRHDVIAIGAVVDDRLELVSEFLCCAYQGLANCQYEQACYKNFWM